ncbi:family 1 glycosyltransferase [Phakopsora pachyrhizi]|nr:family 1 glycosyltransferase [Phakopsora pachyrhizi]
MMLLVRLIQTVRETHLKSIDSSVPLKINKAEGGSRRKRTCRIAVLLGSGGHTAEMIRLLDQLPFDRYTPRIYLICSNDRLSKQKAIQLESSKGKGQFSFAEIPRARNFGQSFLTTPLTTLYSLSFCLYLISIKPLTLGLKNLKKKVLVLNGPGTCVPIAISAFLPRLISFKFSPKIIYVESFTRVKNLSLSGKMLVTMTDEFLVQWKNICLIVVG